MGGREHERPNATHGLGNGMHALVRDQEVVLCAPICERCARVRKSGWTQRWW